MRRAVLVLLAVLLLPATARAQWGPREPAPADVRAGSATVARLLPDGSAAFVADGPDRGGYARRSVWVLRAPGGGLSMAELPPGYGGDRSPTSPELSAPAADGTTFAFHRSSPLGVMRFPLGADPATPVLEPTAGVSALDVAPTGEAVALVNGGNALALTFRPAGPDGRFDAPRTLDRGGAQRAYAVGVTLDPDGGVFVLYETQQPSALLSAYAPPGGDFATPSVVPVGNADPGDVIYGQSTDGHVVAAWDAPPADGSTTNSTRVFAATRAPGGATLTAPALLHQRSADYAVYAGAAGITDSGAAYVGLFDGRPVTGCANNEDSGRVTYLARGGAGGWTTAPAGGGEWPDRAEITRIATSGNQVAIGRTRTRDTGTRCEQGNPFTQQIDVALGTGATLGPWTTLHDRSEVAFQASRIVSVGVDAGGRALLLVQEQQPKPVLYARATGSAPPPPADGGDGGGDAGGGGPAASGGVAGTGATGGAPRAPRTAPEPLPAPGRVTFSRGFAVVDDGTVGFKAGCEAASGGGVDVCKVRVAVRERRTPTANGTAAAAARRGRLAGSAKATVPAGKTRRIVVRLDRRARRTLARKRRLRVVVTVTITRGAAVGTVTKRATLRPAKRR